MYDNLEGTTSISDILNLRGYGISEKLLRGDTDIDEQEFNGLEIFEHILDYLESNQKPKYFASSNINFTPSTDVLRLLVTLLVRTITYETVLEPTNDTLALKRADYLLNSELQAISIRSRITYLIRKYVDEIFYKMEQGPCLLNKSLYKNSLSLLNDFIKKKSTNNQPTIPSKKDIDYLSFPEKGSQGSSKSPYSMPGALSEEDSIICDSEDECLLEFDLMRNFYFSFDHQKKYHDNHEKAQTGFLKNPELKTTKVLGYELLSLKLNPFINSPYNLWDLIDWTFFCAKFYSKKTFSPFYANTSKKGVIFETYNDLIDIFLDLIAIDLVASLKYVRLLNNLRLKYKKVTSGDSLSHNVPEEHSFLSNYEAGRCTFLEGFLAQLSLNPFDVYEKALEHIFFGLMVDEANPRKPSPCYAEEGLLVLDEESSEGQLGIFVNNKIEESLNVRVKLVYIIYYWSKFCPLNAFQTGLKDTSKDLLSTESFLRVLAKKIWSLNFQLFKAFFNTITSVRYNLLEDWNPQRNNMIMNILKYIFMELGDPLLDQFFKRRDIFLSHQDSRELAGSFLYDLIGLLCEEQLYVNILNDQTFKSITDLKNCWLKYNYLLYYLFSYILKIYDSHSKLLLGEKKETIQELFLRVKKADSIKEKIYQGFLKERFILNQHNEKTHLEYNFVLTESQLKEHSENDIGLAKFANIFFSTFSEYFE